MFDESPVLAIAGLVKGANQGEGHKEWLAEINYLGQLRHPNLVKLIGYCLEDDHRLLVYEFMPKGSMENNLFRRGSYFQPFSWSLRMKIALGAARGLAFLHNFDLLPEKDDGGYVCGGWKLVQYETEITAYVEPNKIKKLTGVKTKELFIWITLSDIYVNDPPNGKITFKTPTGLSRCFPVEAFVVEEEDIKKVQEHAEVKPAVEVKEV
ncbi:unnamed protein product [Fraxinus pennsylvanica]|uniref:Protein kinase domain-containing protein n=1 Tax=Fraxinus pennsylvanica TaxID=56036 RepID=A0AAD1ZKY9_9LAMI|nr:unnamed protein product [Fraxinus pennsylvanica]